MVASRPSIYLQPSHICNNDDNDHALGEEEWLPHDHLYICNLVASHICNNDDNDHALGEEEWLPHDHLYICKQATSATMMIMTLL